MFSWEFAFKSSASIVTILHLRQGVIAYGFPAVVWA